MAGASWRIQAAPNKLGPQGFLTGESCAGPKWCMAVGYYYDNSENYAPVAEEWRGTSWAVLSVPAFTGAVETELAGVSCTTSSSCTAVGYYYEHNRTFTLAETWNGTAWAVRTTPDPPPSRASYLQAVSCTSAVRCVAVGYYESHYCFNCSGTWSALAEQWNGTTWIIEPTPDHPGVFNGLSSVSCVSATCIAVGDYEPQWTSPLTLAERWNGSTWSALTVPDPDSNNAGLASVWCTTATSCVAAGSADGTGNSAKTLIETWDGSSWSVQPTPNPGGAASAFLLGIACSSRTSCMAVGELQQTVTYAGVPFALSWNGKAWKLSTVPIPAGAVLYSGLVTVACPSSAACSAAGYYQSSSGAIVTVLEGWDGRQWSAGISPVVGQIPSYLYGVACPSARACTGVGTYVNGQGTSITFAEGWNGSAWTIQPTPDPATGTHWGMLAGVSCPSASRCIAVGEYQDRLGAYRTLAETWNGKSWSISPTPNPAKATGSYLSGISCPSATNCMTVGNYSTASGSIVPLTESWNGTRWTLHPAPAGHSAALTVLNGVACPSATSCVAVGTDGKNPSHTRPLAESWNGTSWRQQQLPVPANSPASALYQVACGSATACTAVGTAGNAYTTLTLAEAWNGTSWTRQSTPNPADEPSTLTGVSCPSANSCIAVGYAVRSTIALTLAEAWNGSTWTIESTPSAHGREEVGTGSFLSAVACLQAGPCTAAGYSENSTFISRPLVLRQT